jgi:hypothetical protein
VILIRIRPSPPTLLVFFLPDLVVEATEKCSAYLVLLLQWQFWSEPVIEERTDSHSGTDPIASAQCRWRNVSRSKIESQKQSLLQLRLRFGGSSLKDYLDTCNSIGSCTVTPIGYVLLLYVLPANPATASTLVTRPELMHFARKNDWIQLDFSMLHLEDPIPGPSSFITVLACYPQHRKVFYATL